MDDLQANHGLRKRVAEIRKEAKDKPLFRWPVKDLLDYIDQLEAESQRYHDQLLWFTTTKDGDREIEYQNRGADLAAARLREIAETGAHKGVFGGKSMEAAAQVILGLRQRLAHIVRAADEMAAAVTSSETSGMEAWIYKMIAARDNYRKARNSTREGDGE